MPTHNTHTIADKQSFRRINQFQNPTTTMVFNIQDTVRACMHDLQEANNLELQQMEPIDSESIHLEARLNRRLNISNQLYNSMQQKLKRYGCSIQAYKVCPTKTGPILTAVIRASKKEHANTKEEKKESSLYKLIERLLMFTITGLVILLIIFKIFSSWNIQLY